MSDKWDVSYVDKGNRNGPRQPNLITNLSTKLSLAGKRHGSLGPSGEILRLVKVSEHSDGRCGVEMLYA